MTHSQLFLDITAWVITVWFFLVLIAIAYNNRVSLLALRMHTFLKVAGVLSICWIVAGWFQ
jgi:hypothetical protein